MLRESSKKKSLRKFMKENALVGPSKKAARNAAAKAALATLCNISYSPMQQTAIAVPKLPNELGKNVELPQTFADVIGK